MDMLSFTYFLLVEMKCFEKPLITVAYFQDVIFKKVINRQSSSRRRYTTGKPPCIDINDRVRAEEGGGGVKSHLVYFTTFLF